MPQKRILFTIPNFDTAGSGGAMLKIAERLDPEVFEPHIACFHNRGESFKNVEASGIPVHLINYVSPARPLSVLFKAAWGVSRKFKTIKPDLIHSYHYSSDYTEALAAKLAGTPWVFTKKNMSWGGSSANSWRLRSLLARGIAIQNTDMQREFYPTSRKTHFIPRGVDVSSFSPRTPLSQIREQMNTSRHSRVVICVANMVPVKGIELLVNAFESARQKSDDWVLWLVGATDNDYGKTLQEQVRAKKLEKVIRFSGKVSNVREYLDHAEIFVLPTKNEGRKEGSPVSMLEAMANGKVVVGSSVPGIKDQLERKPQNLFEAGNELDLAEKLGFFMNERPEENRLLGEEFRKLAIEKYPIELEVQRHEILYKKLLKC